LACAGLGVILVIERGFGGADGLDECVSGLAGGWGDAVPLDAPGRRHLGGGAGPTEAGIVFARRLAEEFERVTQSIRQRRAVAIVGIEQSTPGAKEVQWRREDGVHGRRWKSEVNLFWCLS